MLEKTSAEYIAGVENESKRRELSDHWKSINMLFLKKSNKRWRKKDKNADSYKIRYKYLRKTK